MWKKIRWYFLYIRKILHWLVSGKKITKKRRLKTFILLENNQPALQCLSSSRCWRVLYFVIVIKISISFPTTVLVISNAITFCSAKIILKSQRNLCSSLSGRCLWCNGYRRRKCTRWHEFKSWKRLIAFSHSTNTLGKGMNPNILPPAMGK